MSRTCKKLSENLRYEAIDPPEVILIRCGSVEELATGGTVSCATISADDVAAVAFQGVRRVRSRGLLVKVLVQQWCRLGAGQVQA